MIPLRINMQKPCLVRRGDLLGFSSSVFQNEHAPEAGQIFIEYQGDSKIDPHSGSYFYKIKGVYILDTI